MKIFASSVSNLIKTRGVAAAQKKQYTNSRYLWVGKNRLLLKCNKYAKRNKIY